ncbi:hypothetical protein CIHG_05802 [Coccidioides immitis H538.4]|uniref:Uncharacterized protein n=3 Tax=Coccidioides immitis TaxID=5501 RepID=A0A0J8QY36_COCIT|nr:hypothetical protein CIRG_01871 [Coccidioides immitis RMSCC 2394]KMU76288.1 hypothetical protein CISG_01022 [Coccidioides immitis RMSCC 3703]KMU88034.1 hypothetical protein CIHG_05802 [Coccidioides immitis H538.4]
MAGIAQGQIRFAIRDCKTTRSLVELSLLGELYDVEVPTLERPSFRIIPQCHGQQQNLQRLLPYININWTQIRARVHFLLSYFERLACGYDGCALASTLAREKTTCIPPQISGARCRLNTRRDSQFGRPMGLYHLVRQKGQSARGICEDIPTDPVAEMGFQHIVILQPERSVNP